MSLHDDVVAMVAQSAQAAHAAGAADWPSLRRSMIKALRDAEDPADLVNAAASAVGRIARIELRRSLVRQLGAIGKYRTMTIHGKSNAIAADLLEYFETRFQEDLDIPSADPDRLFYRIIVDARAVVGIKGLPPKWKTIRDDLVA